MRRKRRENARAGSIADMFGAIVTAGAARLLRLGGIILRAALYSAGCRLEIFRQYEPRPLRPAAASTARRSHTLSIAMVTPSLNQGRFIEKTILSVLSQEYPLLQYAVQDGGSSDETVSILERYGSRLGHWESGKDGGQAEAINRGFSRITGDVMAYLNSDDILLEGALDFVAGYFSAHPEADVIYGHRIIIDEEGREIGRWILPRHDGSIIRWSDYIPQETMFWRRRIWESVGGRLDEGYQFAMDWDLILRFSDAGAVFRRVPVFLAAFRHHAGQKTISAMETGIREITAIRRRLHGRDIDGRIIELAVLPYKCRHIIYAAKYRAGELFRRFASSAGYSKGNG